jgi:dolichol-phosphate mannosyltransferase
MDAIFSFSYKPLRLGMVLGGIVLAFTLFLSLVNLGNTVFHLKYFGIIPGSGHIGTLLAILFLGSVQLICTGLLGEYIGRIYDEVRRRPLYLVHRLHRSEAEGVLVYKTDKVLASVHDSVA